MEILAAQGCSYFGAEVCTMRIPVSFGLDAECKRFAPDRPGR